MPHVTLSFGYDTERPYGTWARGPEGARMREAQLAMVERLNAALDDLDAPRTFFLLGDYLEQCARAVPVERLRSLYDPHHPLIDVQQHSYSHPSVRPIAGRTGEGTVTARAFGEDVRRATRLIEELLGTRVSGMRIPRGYDEDLTSLPEVAREIRDAGLDFVSSDLRSPSADGRESFEGAMTRERQPHGYDAIDLADLVELPSHGYQDAFFTADFARRVFGGPPWETERIVAHYVGLLDHARALAGPDGEAHVSLCLHPFALLEYDPDLVVHRQLVEAARAQDVEILSYRALADRVHARRAPVARAAVDA